MRLEFNHGFNILLDEIDASPHFDVDKYNKDGYEQLYIYNNENTGELENFYIPLYYDFIATADPDILKDDPDEVLDYDNIIICYSNGHY